MHSPSFGSALSNTGSRAAVNCCCIGFVRPKSPFFGSALSKTPATRLAVNRSCIGFVWPKSPFFGSVLSKYRHPARNELCCIGFVGQNRRRSAARCRNTGTRAAVNCCCIGFVRPKSPSFGSALSEHRHPGCSEPLLHWVRSAKIAVVRQRRVLITGAQARSEPLLHWLRLAKTLVAWHHAFVLSRP
jgi:hypothetical protein